MNHNSSGSRDCNVYPTRIRTISSEVSVERERILRLPQHERELELHEWHSNRERSINKEQVPLEEIWEKIFAYGINVLQSSRMFAAASLDSSNEYEQPFKIRRKSEFSSSGRGSTYANHDTILAINEINTSDQMAVEDTTDSEDKYPAAERCHSKHVSPNLALSSACKTVLHAIVDRVNSPYPYCYGGADQTPILYEWMKGAIGNYLQAFLAPCVRSQRDLQLMEEFTAAWEDHMQFTKNVWMIFNSLDRNCCMERKLPTVASVSLQLFYEHIFVPRGEQVLGGILQVMQRMRDRVNEIPLTFDVLAPLMNYTGAADVDTSIRTAQSIASKIFMPISLSTESCLPARTTALLCESISVWVLMGIASCKDLKSVSVTLERLSRARTATMISTKQVERDLYHYHNEFEPAFLHHTKKYFEMKSLEWLESGDVLAYLTCVARTCSTEHAFADKHLYGATQLKVCAVCVEVTVVKQRQWLLQHATRILLEIFCDVRPADTPDVQHTRRVLRSMFGLFRYAKDIALNMLPHLDRTQAELPHVDLALAKLERLQEFDLVKELAMSFKTHIQQQGQTLIDAKKAEIAQMAADYEQWSLGARQNAPPKRPSIHDSALVESLLALLTRCKAICREVFDDDELFLCALKNGLVECINDTTLERPSTIEVLAAYCNKILRKGGFKKVGGDQALETELAAAIELLTLSREKDVFEESYRVLLADRILSKTSSSSELESHMVGAMKNLQGLGFTTKMESMLSDCVLAEEMFDKFRQWCQMDELARGALSSVDVKVHAFTFASWPSTGIDDLSVTLPREVRANFDHFGAFYAASYPGRKLRWVFARGDMEVKMTLESGVSYNLIVSTLQGIVLGVFDNESGSLSLDDIAMRTGIANKDVLKALLLSLCQPLTPKEPRTKLLLKGPFSGGHAPSSQISISSSSSSSSMDECLSASATIDCAAHKNGVRDEYKANTEFVSRSRRLAVKSPVFVFDQPSDALKESIVRGRVLLLEAAIVKIMKASKTLQHTELCLRVQSHLSNQFAPSAADVKKRIESLIDREYLTRELDDSDPNNNILVYIA